MRYKESETVELKKSTSELKEAVISIVAMLNKHGKGMIYFGIKDDGTIIGQQTGKETLRDVAQLIAERIEPKIFPRIKTISIHGKICVAIKFEGAQSPYFAYGRAYTRVADTDRQISARELERMVLHKNRNALSWDTEPCDQADLNDISIPKIKAFAVASGLKYDSLHNVLTKLKLLSDSKPSNAAVLLFGKKPEDIFLNARLRCAVFSGTDTAYITDMKDYYGDAFYLIEKAQEYILEKINIGMRIEGLRRIDVPEIDQEAFREAIINAFCHRDYREPDSVNIAILKDRIEIRSQGLLYGGLTIQQIRTKLVSERRNELIADMFQRIHFVERWGRGIKLILDKEPTVEFMEIGTHFITVFKRRAQTTIPPVAEKSNEKSNEKSREKILRLMFENSAITTQEISETIGLSLAGVEKAVRALKQEKRLRRIGPDKGGYWDVIK